MSSGIFFMLLGASTVMSVISGIIIYCSAVENEINTWITAVLSCSPFILHVAMILAIFLRHK